MVALGGEYEKLEAKYCSTFGNFTGINQYQVKLGNLLSDLPLRAVATRGNANGTAGKAPDMIFDLSMCYADYDWMQCLDCLWGSARWVPRLWSSSRVAKAIYDACILRYSDEPFLSIADLNSAYYMYSNSFVTDIAT
ncbi:hypothetical protein ACP70R_018270 [Stipagrostis hirtigluma subsp. patula]